MSLVLNLVYPKVSLRLSRICTDLLCGICVNVTVSAGVISCTKRVSWHSTILRIHYLLHLVLSGAILHRTILHGQHNTAPELRGEYHPDQEKPGLKTMLQFEVSQGFHMYIVASKLRTIWNVPDVRSSS